MSVIDILDVLPTNGHGNQLIELGKIKIGGKAKQERQTAGGATWRAPEKYDHFVITTMNRDSRGDLIIDTQLMDQLIAKHGDPDGKLRQIPIRLLSDDIEDVVQSAFVWYGGKTVGGRSDGKTITWFHDPNTLKKEAQPYEEPWNPEILKLTNGKGQKLFKTHTNFSCVIAAQEARWGGVYKFRTTSVISLRQLHSSLVHLSQLTRGILSGMPLMLVLRPMQVAPEGKPSTVYVVHVELRGGDMMQMQNQALQMANFRVAFANQIQTTQRQYKKLLLPPGTETDVEAKDISEEFSPDVDGAGVPTIPEGAACGILDGEEEATPQQKAALEAAKIGNEKTAPKAPKMQGEPPEDPADKLLATPPERRGRPAAKPAETKPPVDTARNEAERFAETLEPSACMDWLVERLVAHPKASKEALAEFNVMSPRDLDPDEVKPAVVSVFTAIAKAAGAKK